VRPHGKGVLKPRHNMIIGGEGTRGGLMGRSPGGSEASFAGVRSPPLRGGTVQARMALRGQTRGRRERRFPRRGAVPAPANTGRTQAGACHRHRLIGDSMAAKKRHIRVGVMPTLRACGARPSAGWTTRSRKALRWRARGWRKKPFSRRGALCAPALQGLTRATAFHRATWAAGWPWA
jgi:hypothetical protein